MNKGRSQDSNRPIQDIAHIYDGDVIIMTPGRNMKKIKYCAISLTMLHTRGLCGVLGFTSSL